MSPRNGQDNARSQSRGRRSKRGSKKADPDARSADSQHPREPSPACVDHIPINNNNKKAMTKPVSTRSSSCPVNKGLSHTKTSAYTSSAEQTAAIKSAFSCSDHHDAPVNATLQVSDNTGSQGAVSAPLPPDDIQDNRPGMDGKEPQDPFKSSPMDPWHLTFTELRAMRATTESFSKELQLATSRTTKIEASVDSNIDRITTLEKEVQSLKNTVQKQEEIISGVKSVKEDFSKKSARVIEQMNDLLVQQKGQVRDFQSSAQKIKAQATSEAKKQVSALARDIAHNSLKEKAFQNRHNLVVVGLKEHPTNSAYSVIKDFFKTELKLNKLDIHSAYRMGSPPVEDSDYCRPMLVKFNEVTHRNTVWRKRNAIPAKDGGRRIRVQADLPKELRQEVQLLYRVVRAASKIPQFQSASVRNYALLLNGKEYPPRELESLPIPIRPSTISVSKSDTALVFFSKHCELSNHFPSEFTIEQNTFSNMEHYLAFQRAIITDDPALVDRALQCSDPMDAKAMLNSLRNNRLHDWELIRDNIALDGLKAKFMQNKNLHKYLADTADLRLGEASQNGVWGIGLTLDDPCVLDTGKWLASGNLLGVLLIRVREGLGRKGERN